MMTNEDTVLIRRDKGLINWCPPLSVNLMSMHECIPCGNAPLFSLLTLPQEEQNNNSQDHNHPLDRLRSVEFDLRLH